VKTFTLYIKNMVCPRCVTAVEQTLTETGIPFESVKLGEAVVLREPGGDELRLLDKKLRNIGFELITDKKKILTEQIKSLLISHIHHSNGEHNGIVYSECLSEKTGKSYSYLSKVFSETEGITIEKFIIIHKTEKVKELIGHNSLNFSEIAYKLDYSSVAHLSRQFKKITGMTLSEYKNSTKKDRKFIDGLH